MASSGVDPEVCEEMDFGISEDGGPVVGAERSDHWSCGIFKLSALRNASQLRAMMVVRRWVVARKSSRVDQEIQSLRCAGQATRETSRQGAGSEPAGVEDISASTSSVFVKIKGQSSALRMGRRAKM